MRNDFGLKNQSGGMEEVVTSGSFAAMFAGILEDPLKESS